MRMKNYVIIPGRVGLLLAVIMLSFGVVYGQASIDYQSLVAGDETTTDIPVGYGYSNHGPYIAKDLIWVFYSDGENAVWRTKHLDETAAWSGKSTIFNESNGSHFHVTFDGEYFHFIHQVAEPQSEWGDLEYVRAKPEKDGSMTFDTPVTVYTDDSWKVSDRHFTIKVDHLKNPWIVTKVRSGNSYKAIVLSSTASDGTWQDRPGFPKDLSNTTTYDINGRAPNIIEKDEGEILFTWRNHEASNSGMRARLWTADPGDPAGEGSLGDEETTTIGSTDASSANTSVVSPEPGVVLLNSNTVVARRNADGTWQSVTPPSGLNQVFSNSMSVEDGVVRLWDIDGNNIRYRETSDNGSTWGPIVGKWSASSPNFVVATNPVGSWTSHHSVMWRSGSEPYDVYMGIDGTIPQPEAPQLVSPADQSSDLTADVSFVWNSVIFAGPYDFQIATDSDFTELVVDESGIADTTITITELDLNLHYYWRVRATGIIGGPASDWSDVWEFETVGIPPAPALTSPADGSEDQPTSITFEWGESAGAETYQLQVATVDDFSSTFANVTDIQNTEYEITGLDNDRTYYWRVRAKNEFGEGEWSQVWNLHTVIAAPSAPVLSSPANEAQDQPVTLAFEWQESDRAETYRLQVSEVSDFSSTVVNTGGITDTSYEVSDLDFSQTYYWRVNATNESGTGSWSPVWSFTTIIEQPDVPVLVSPADGEDGVSTKPSFNWEESDRADTYRLQVATAAEFDSIVVDVEDIDNTTLSLTEELDAFTGYYWRVNATNVGGTSDWSDIWEFETGQAFPVAPVLDSPADGSTERETELLVLWNSVPTATRYHLQVADNSDFDSPVVENDEITNTFYTVSDLEGYTQYYWRVRAISDVGAGDWSSTWSFTTKDVTSVRDLAGEIPDEFNLQQNYPNPFNPTTTIRFGIPEASTVTLEVYNMIGQRVATIIDGEFYAAGTYEAMWDAKDEMGREMSSGMYIYRISAGDYVNTKKMLFMK